MKCREDSNGISFSTNLGSILAVLRNHATKCFKVTHQNSISCGIDLPIRNAFTIKPKASALTLKANVSGQILNTCSFLLSYFPLPAKFQTSGRMKGSIFHLDQCPSM